MYCKNCGNLMDANASVCIKCGVPRGAGVSFCHNCGAQAIPNAVVCTNCGVSLGNKPNAIPGQKSKLVAGLLGIFLGTLGIHNFYLGYTGKAVAQLLISLLTCGVGAVAVEIWGIIEGVMILTGSINTDGNGNPLGD